MSRAGYVMLLTMCIVGAVAAGGVVVTNRAGVHLRARKVQAAQAQAEWLGRSALAAGWTGERRVETGAGVATVRIHPDRGTATVRLGELRLDVSRSR